MRLSLPDGLTVIRWAFFINRKPGEKCDCLDVIKSICAYCQTILGYKEDDSLLERVSHGVCSVCLEKLSAKSVSLENSIEAEPVLALISDKKK